MRLPRHATALFLLLAISQSLCFGQERGLRGQLEALVKETGIAIEGRTLIIDEEATTVSGDLRTRLEGLLKNYNYLMIENPPGTIAKVILISAKPATPTNVANPYVKTTREGLHHRVDAEIAGPLGPPSKLSLLVDTGASTVVLPYSMIQPLGFQMDALGDTSMQTANGQTLGKIGLLKTVTIGSISAHDVEVGFVPDDKLGTALLGMSFLSRFKLTFDDEHNEILLYAK